MYIFAHRGYSAVYPENTLLAFTKGIEAGADGIELDVRLSADDQVVVCHDDTVGRTTNGSGEVASMPLEQLKRLDAGVRFGSRFIGERIPTLAEVLYACKDKALINIELADIGTSSNTLLAESVVRIVRDHNAQRSVFFSSFHFNHLVRIKAEFPDMFCALLVRPGVKGFTARNFLKHSSYVNGMHPHYKEASAALIHSEHLVGRKVNVWTVNDADMMRNLYTWGADGVFTDDPVMGRAVADEMLDKKIEAEMG